MPPRRGQRKAATPSTSATSSALDLSQVSSQLYDAVANWESTGKDTAKSILSTHLDAPSASPLASLPLFHILISLFTSPIDASQLFELLSELIDGFEEDVKLETVETLGEALVDVVEVLEEDREDCEDIAPSQQQDGMEVDGEGKGKRPGEKGLEVIKLLLSSNHLPSHIPNLLLSPQLLVALGLHPIPHNPQALQRAFIKRNTTLFFKQSKYNLLRESSEGFSGLIVLLTSADALPLASSIEAEPDAVRKERAKRVWAKVMGLIGYFNLSPPRVLDIILEIASCHVATHWRFFLDLLRCSPWGRAAVEQEGRGKGKERAVDNWVDGEIEGIERALNEGGERVLSQVLGVKFGFFQRPDGGDTSIGLVYITALLIKHRFVSLSNILAFLSPDDAEMDNIHKRYLSSISSRSGPSNALANSVLLDDDAPTTTAGKDSETTGPPPKPPPEQRIMLLQALLAIGDLPSAQYLLGRHPWLAQSHPPIADLILRIVSHALEGLYRQTSTPIEERDEVSDGPSATTSAARILAKETVPTLSAPVPPPTSSKIFEFFYPDWLDGMETWATQEEIHDKGLRWLSLVRGLGGRAPDVMVKVCRIGAAYFARLRRAKEDALGIAHPAKRIPDIQKVEPSAEEMRPWLDIIRISLLPALSASNVTASFDIELFALLKHFPYPVRYSLYGEWRDSTCAPRGRNLCPVAAHAYAEATRDIKKALSRVTASQSTPAGPSAVTDRGPARALAKLSHANPCALWTTAVTQVKAYSNIGQFIVEAGRYMTQLSMDVATFTLVDTLSDDTASRLNPTGTDVAQWLSSLATFVGDFNRRYATMDLEPVLQFVINRLMRGESGDLTILSKLITIMSGATLIENDAISEDQLQAYATGREMVREAFNTTSLQIARPADLDPAGAGAKAKGAALDKSKSTKKSLPRLINALRDTSLAMPIWIALAQTRQGVVDKMANVPIKAMASMQDTVHEIFIQYGDLLDEQLSSDEHVSSTPDLSDLVTSFGLDYAMAFQILRPRLNAEFERAEAERKGRMEQKLAAEKAAGGSPAIPPSTPLPASPTTESMQLDGEAGQELAVPEGVNGDGPGKIPAPKSAIERKSRSWVPAALTATMQQAQSLLPQEVTQIMSAPFFVIFWHLCMSDIAFSPESYQRAIHKINAMEKDVASWRTTNPTEQRNERARLKARVEQLEKERDAQSALVKGPMRKRLRLESSKWFGRAIAEGGLQRRLSYQLHQYCFYPRSLLTPSDAVFVAKFIRVMHELGTVGFSTLFAYDNFFGNQLAACIFSSTTNEARNFGRTLAAIMADLDAWHADERKYKLEALGIPDAASAKSANGAEQQVQPLPGMVFRAKTGVEPTAMTWTQFRNFYAKCHRSLTDALVSCWQETDFMHIKNGITVALQVLKYFPAMDTNGQAIEAAVKDLVAGKNGTLTPDVQHQCQAYLRNLTQRQQSRPYISPGQFHSAGITKQPPVVPNGPAKSAPTGPRGSAPSTPIAINGAAKAANGSATPPSRPTGPSGTDPKILRQKLEEARSTRSQAKASATVAKHDTKAKIADTTLPEAKPADPAAAEGKASATPPAGPRATRSTASAAPPAPSGPGASTRSNSSADIRPTPTGPATAAAIDAKAATMGPPARGTSIDEDRAAARARRFGSLSQSLTAQAAAPSGPGALSAPSAPTGPAALVQAETKREKSPTPSSRRPSPSPAPTRSRRSGSVESRASERSRRDRDRLADKARENGTSSPVATRGSGERRAPGEGDKDDGRRRQEDLLQARHERLATDDRSRDRRGSREERRGDREKDRDDARGKERDRGDRDSGRERRDAGDKRKRGEEPPRRIDDPRDRHHDDRRDRDRREGSRREDRHRDDRRDSRDDRRERDRRDERPDDRDRRRREHDRDPRDTRDALRSREPSTVEGTRPRGPSPGKREPERSSRTAANGNQTPKREESKRDSAPVSSAIEGRPEPDRIVEPPRSTRGAEGVRGLPARPGSSRPDSQAPQPRDAPLNVERAGSMRPSRSAAEPIASSNEPAHQTRSPMPPRTSAEPASSQARPPAGLPARPSASQPQSTSSLAARMGPPPSHEAPSESRAAEQERAPTPSSGEARKRPHEETTQPPREDSPGASKRVKIDRDRARRPGASGGSGSASGSGSGGGAGNRLLASAMKGAGDK